MQDTECNQKQSEQTLENEWLNIEENLNFVINKDRGQVENLGHVQDIKTWFKKYDMFEVILLIKMQVLCIQISLVVSGQHVLYAIGG